MRMSDSADAVKNESEQTDCPHLRAHLASVRKERELLLKQVRDLLARLEANNG